MSRKSVWVVAFAFALSGFAVSFIGIYGLHNIVRENEILEKTLGIAGVIILLYHAFKAYKSAKNCEHHNAGKTGDIVVALAMVWLTPHVYADMFVISSIAMTRDASEYPALIAGFSIMGLLWFSLLALFTKTLSRWYKTSKIHTTMHYASAIILILAGITTFINTFFESAHHYNH